MPPEPRYHILTFAIGERFRYREGGPIFARVGGPGDAVRVRRVDGGPAATADYQTYVLPVDPPSGGDFEGLGLSGFDAGSGEEGGGA